MRPGLDPLSIPPVPKSARSRSQRAVAAHQPVGTQNLWFPIGPIVMTERPGRRQPQRRRADPRPPGRAGHRSAPVRRGRGRRACGSRPTAGGRLGAARRLRRCSRSQRRRQRSPTPLSCGAIHVDLGRARPTAPATSSGSAPVRRARRWRADPALPADGGRRRPAGRGLLGVGFLHRDPAVAGGAWTIVKGDLLATDHDTLRGADCLPDRRRPDDEGSAGRGNDARGCTSCRPAGRGPGVGALGDAA